MSPQHNLLHSLKTFNHHSKKGGSVGSFKDRLDDFKGCLNGLRSATDGRLRQVVVDEAPVYDEADGFW